MRLVCGSFKKNFRCHVVLSAHEVRAALVVQARRAKINQFQIEVLVKQNILKFQISVAYTSFMHELDGIDELQSVVQGHRAGQSLLANQELAQVTVRCQLESDVRDAGLFSTFVSQDRIDLGFKWPQNAWMAQPARKIDLSLHKLGHLLLVVGEENLQGVGAPVVAFGLCSFHNDGR